MNLFYNKKNGQRVFLVNRHPRNLSSGGMIRYHPSDITTPDSMNDDNISALLEVGSLVIPRPVVKYLLDYPHPEHFNGNAPLVKDSSKLAPVCVMTNEVIVPKKHAPKVEKFLKEKYGITLPISENFIS